MKEHQSLDVHWIRDVGEGRVGLLWEPPPSLIKLLYRLKSHSVRKGYCHHFLRKPKGTPSTPLYRR